jgi:hypothetical protein
VPGNIREERISGEVFGELFEMEHKECCSTSGLWQQGFVTSTDDTKFNSITFQ